jgi:hypothetical protein
MAAGEQAGCEVVPLLLGYTFERLNSGAAAVPCYVLNNVMLADIIICPMLKTITLHDMLIRQE